MIDELAATIERWRTEPLPIAPDTDGDRPVEDLGMTAPLCRVLWAGYKPTCDTTTSCCVNSLFEPCIRLT